MLSHLIKTTATTTKNLQRKSLSFIYRCFDIIYQATECIVPSFVYSHIYFNISLFILPSSIINQLVLREDVQFLYGENLTISEQQKRLGKKGLSGEEGGRGACVQRQGAAVRSRWLCVSFVWAVCVCVCSDLSLFDCVAHVSVCAARQWGRQWAPLLTPPPGDEFPPPDTASVAMVTGGWKGYRCGFSALLLWHRGTWPTVALSPLL